MRGQISLEAILTVGLAIIVFTSLVNLATERYSSAIELGEMGEAKMFGEFLAEAIDSVNSNGKGFSIVLREERFNLSYLNNIGVSFEICNSNTTIYVIKNTSKIGSVTRIARVHIIPNNIIITSNNASEVTVTNNGTNIIVAVGNNIIALGCRG